MEDKKDDSLTFDDVLKMGHVKADKLLRRLIKARISRNGKGNKEEILVLEFRNICRRKRRK